MKVIRLLPFCLCNILFAACAQNEVADEQLPLPIEFTQTVKPQTRGTDLTTDNLSAIGVFAYFTHGNFEASTATPNFMYNLFVEKSVSGEWSYTPVKYWPNNMTDKLSFFAYAPYVSEGGSNLSFSKETDSGYPTLTYTVPPAEASQTDLLVATPQMNQNFETSKGKVRFQLKHALTKVAVYVKSNDNTAGKTITAFSMEGTKSGTLTYHTPTDTSDKGFSWKSLTSAKGTFTATSTNFPVPDNTTDARQLFATFFLLPHGTEHSFNLSYTYTNDAGSTITINLKNQPLPSPEKWQPGASVSYTIGIEKKAVITVTTDSRPTWTEGDTDKVTGNEN